jgi:hypothetical protein
MPAVRPLPLDSRVSAFPRSMRLDPVCISTLANLLDSDIYRVDEVLA